MLYPLVGMTFLQFLTQQGAKSATSLLNFLLALLAVLHIQDADGILHILSLLLMVGIFGGPAGQLGANKGAASF